MASAISRREMFKQVANKRSLQILGILLPGGLERILGIGNIDAYGSAEEAGLALGRRRRNRPPKFMWNMSSAKSGESKVATSDNSVQEEGGGSQ